MSDLQLPDRYGDVLADLKDRVRAAQLRAHRVVNTELIALYWQLGRTILDQQDEGGWGAKVVERLARDLRREFPEMTGLSRSNLLYMRGFAKAWPDGDAVVQQPVGRLPWGQVATLLDKLATRDERDWYAAMAVEHGWSRNVLRHQIMNQLRQRTGAAPSNFAAHLGEAESKLAQEIAKDPYVFDFLGLADGVAERDLEQAMMQRIVDVLRELGPGWAFVDRQKHIEIDGDDFSIDLLFFHTEQLRYVVFELKAGKFRPEYTGQLGFYVAVVDDRIRSAHHAPTIGILLCTDKNDAVVRYALGAAAGALAVSSYTYDTLPPAEQAILPDVEQLRHALEAQGSQGG